MQTFNFKALYANEDFNLEEMHNYRMAVTEREVINGCLNVDNVSKSKVVFKIIKYVVFFVNILSKVYPGEP